jgi:hypothetical protein
MIRLSLLLPLASLLGFGSGSGFWFGLVWSLGWLDGGIENGV